MGGGAKFISGAEERRKLLRHVDSNVPASPPPGLMLQPRHARSPRTDEA